MGPRETGRLSAVPRGGASRRTGGVTPRGVGASWIGIVADRDLPDAPTQGTLALILAGGSRSVTAIEPMNTGG